MLGEVGAAHKRTLMVFDKLTISTQTGPCSRYERYPDHVEISALTGTGIDTSSSASAESGESTRNQN